MELLHTATISSLKKKKKIKNVHATISDKSRSKRRVFHLPSLVLSLENDRPVLHGARLIGGFDYFQLVAGSGSQGNSSGGVAGKADDTPEAVPGPVTRLFVIANRGISNLIQDLILVSNAHSFRIIYNQKVFLKRVE